MNVKTTKIEKKYKDKKTGEWKSISIEHAKVKDRLKAFWEANPMGKIETSSSQIGENFVFKTFILSDKSNPASREATGHSMGKIEGEKDFEKLETISVGRALALLGYATDGEVASMEEMEDYINFKKEQHANEVEEYKKELKKIKTLDGLKSAWDIIPATVKKDLVEFKDGLKAKLTKNETA